MLTVKAQLIDDPPHDLGSLFKDSLFVLGFTAHLTLFKVISSQSVNLLTLFLGNFK